MIPDNIKIWLDFLQLLIIPMFGMVWGVQGRISKMEGELKALYHLIEILTDRRKETRE